MKSEESEMSEFSNQEVPPFSTGPEQKPEPGVKHSPKSSQILAIVALAISIIALTISQGSLDRKEQSEQLSSAVSEADLYSPPNDLKKLISTVEESLVAIECNGWGTGFILDTPPETQGYFSVVVTNFHVVEDCIGNPDELIVLTRPDQSGRPNLKLIRWDEENDLAIIEIDEEIPGLISAETFAERGWWTMAMGSPVDMDFEEPAVLYNSTTFGHISYVLDEYWNYTSATINGGNSGGPLVNSRGELIGINTLAAASTEGGVWNVAIDSAALCKKIYQDCEE